MKCEIINPSDKCFFECDDELVASISCLFLGEGKYGLKEVETGKTILPLLIFGGADKWLQEHGVADLGKYVEQHKKELSICFKSFLYDGKRSSLNNIEAKAKCFADLFEKEI